LSLEIPIFQDSTGRHSLPSTTQASAAFLYRGYQTYYFHRQQQFFVNKSGKRVE
jgi:hypothetical protein